MYAATVTSRTQWATWQQAGAAALLLQVLAAGTAIAAPDTSGLTGDWGGVRTGLDGQGISLTGTYTAEMAGNVHGGDRRLARYADQWA